MTLDTPSTPELIRKAVTEVASLTDDDLVLVIEFVTDLKKIKSADEPKPTVAEIHAEAKKRAAQLKNAPRAEVVARFNAVAKRAQAQTEVNGTAFDGDWLGD